MNATTPALLRAALSYAKHGWFVFPLLPNSKRPACPAHPADRCDRTDPWCRNGHTSWEQRATQNPDRIRRAWSMRPYGIGLACGPSRLLVIDTDLPKAGQRGMSGEDVLAVLVGDRPFPATYTVQTPSGGVHRYYRTPTHLRLRNTARRLGELIDTRGHGGYVVAPPTSIDRRPYKVLWDGPCADLPTWLARLLTSPHQPPHPSASRPPGPQPAAPATLAMVVPAGYVTAALAGETAHVRTARPGQRNHTLFCAAVALGQLVAADLVDEHIVRDQLREACADHITAGAFTTTQADATITSGLTRGQGQPRRRPGRNVA